MKKFANRFFARPLLMAGLASGIFLLGCNDSSDYNKEGGTAAEVDTSSSMVNHDTAMQHNNNGNNTVMESDTTAMTSTTTEKVAAADPTASKTPRKRKVSIVMTGDAADKTAAMEMDKEGYYRNTEVLPGFPGGQKALERFFETNIQYPDAATENEAQGTVKLSFAVDENGKIFQPVAIGEKVGYGIEEEAIRVFNKMPKWTPGKIKGKNVKTRFTLPIKFEIY